MSRSWMKPTLRLMRWFALLLLIGFALSQPAPSLRIVEVARNLGALEP